MKAWSSYWAFYREAGTVYTNQSSLLHRFYENVLNPSRHKAEGLSQLDRKYETMRLDSTLIARTDLGTGVPRTESAAQIAKKQVSTKSDLHNWYRLASFLRPKVILELGTSLGWSSAFLAKGNPDAQVITIDGDESLVKYAKQLHQRLNISNSDIIHSSFEDFFKSNPDIQADVIFIDGNHTLEATMKYTSEAYRILAPKGLVILHDILWSDEMYRAWKQIITDNRVTASLQYENVGFLFTDRAFLEKINETWIRWYLKPWTRYFTW